MLTSSKPRPVNPYRRYSNSDQNRQSAIVRLYHSAFDSTHEPHTDEEVALHFGNLMPPSIHPPRTCMHSDCPSPNGGQQYYTSYYTPINTKNLAITMDERNASPRHPHRRTPRHMQQEAKSEVHLNRPEALHHHTQGG